MSNQPLLTADRIRLRFGERLLFEELSIEISPGEVWAVTGPSGAGKSSLLKCLSGEIPCEGRVSRQARMAEIPQALALNEELSARENVAIARFLHGRSSLFQSILPAGKDWNRKAEEALRKLCLNEPDAETARLSGGEKQRVAAARALLSGWQVLLADEPISQLDEKNSRTVLRAMVEEAQKRKGSLVLVLHHEALAREFATRTLRIGGTA